MNTYNVGCFGKLPYHGDYLNLQPGHFPVEQFENWFVAGQLDAQSSDGRMSAYDSGTAAFAMFPGVDRWWGVAVFPSQDQVGRRYPFVLCTEAPREIVADEIALIPSLFSNFFQSAYLASMGGWPTDHHSLKAMLQSLSGQFDPPRYAYMLANAMANTRARELWTALLGSADERRSSNVLAKVINLATGNRGNWGIRIQPSVHQSHVSFWLWVISTLRNHRPPPDLIVMHPGHQGLSPATFLLYDRPAPESIFAALWPRCSVSSFDGQITDLASMERSRGEIQGQDLDELLSQPDMSLRDLLHSLSTWWRSQQRHHRRKSSTV